jgi:hypothetical protein
MSVLSRIGTTVKDLLRWLHALWHWLREPHLVWATVLVLAVAGVGAFWLRSEPAFRRIGLGLQLLGSATVAWNIRGTRTLFDRPGTFALAAQWWRRRPRFRSSVVVAVGAGSIRISGGRPRVDIWHSADPNAASALETRLDAAEKNLSRIRDRLDELEQETTRSLQRQVNALEQEKRDRADDYRNARDKLEAAQAGGLHISVVGVVWLVAGVIMSSIPGELACLAGFVFP